LVEIGLVVLEKKVDAGRTTNDGQRTLRHGISSHGLWPGELKINESEINSPILELIIYEKKKHFPDQIENVERFYI